MKAQPYEAGTQSLSCPGWFKSDCSTLDTTLFHSGYKRKTAFNTRF